MPEKSVNFTMSKDFHQMNALRKVLASNVKIINLLNLVRGVLDKFKNRSEDEFLNSMDLRFLSK